MKCLTENASWNFDIVHNYFKDTNVLTLVSLNMCSFCVQIDDFKVDEYMMNNMFIFLKHTHEDRIKNISFLTSV